MAWFFLSRIFSSAITVVVLIVLTRALGPAGFGKYNITLLSGTIAYFVLFGWLSMSITRFHNAAEFKGKTIAIAMGAGLRFVIVLLPVVVLSYILLSQNFALAILLSAVFCVSHAMHEGGLAGLRVYNSGPDFARATLLRPALGITFTLVLVSFGGGYVSAVLGMSLGAAIMGAYALTKVIRRSGIMRPNASALKRYFSFGAPLGFVASGSMMIVLISQGVLSWSGDLEMVGIYAAAQTLAMRSITMPMTTLSSVTAATIFQSFEEDGHTASDQALERHFSFLLLVSLPILAIMVFSNQTVAAILFDQSFRSEVARQLPILAIAAFITGVQGAYYSFAFMIGKKTEFQVYILIGTTVTHFFVSMAAIYLFGGIGATYAILVNSVLGLGAYIFFGRSIRVMYLPISEVRKMALATFALSGFAFAADYTGSVWISLALISIGMIVFGTVLYFQRQKAMLTIVSKISKLLVRKPISTN